jgi:acetyl-CoA carboxylase biotin carboxylase subunit
VLKKVLVANRGEIAVRVLRACHELGLETVAVFSDIDRAALHVRYAGQALRLGPAPARESYLRGDLIIQAALESGADAIHPGYGFLAENAAFARSVGEAGLEFVGPPSGAIAMMGNKLAARQAMQTAGVPVVQGTDASGSDQDLLDAAHDIGYPVLVKAAAGGGGKGMRLAADRQSLISALPSARREAQAAFGDGSVYLEKVIDGARHIEIQILADSHANVIHLGERECSIQRRYQKVVEECPSPVITPELRQGMGAAAVAAARAVGYVNAGTVEFLVDKEGRFYFLEMNTRLQVEHPVTEFVTGVDIVKEMLRIAGGRKLRYQQADIEWNGCAIECRINAEDPFANFMPSTGRVSRLVEPTGPGVRVDSGLYEGVDVTPNYDPLLAKLIAWGESRALAIQRMRRALNEYKIIGVVTTLPLHQQIMESTEFILAQYDTRWLSDAFRIGHAHGDETEEAAVAVAALLSHQRRQHALTTLSREAPDGSAWRLHGRLAQMRGR